MQSKPLKIFFAGIGGSGVSAIASFMADKGHVVAGSDRAFDTQSKHPLKKSLQKKGITIVPQDGRGLDRSFDCAVFSTAVEHAHPEFIKAKSLGIPVKTRSEYLAEIAASFTTIAVSGTSGKTTATGLLAFLMHRLGLEPNYIGGGRVKQFKSPSHPGNSLSGTSEYLILEACESDGSIIQFTPQYLIILNLAFDHNPVHDTAKMFQTLMSNTKKKVFINADDKNLGLLTSKNAITFSLQKPSPYRAEDVIIKHYSAEFSLQGTHFSLSLPGEYNLYNALSCIAFLSEIGLPLKNISSALPEFQGIDRRFDVYLNDADGFVLDDYAHNPHKISSLMKTVSRLRERVCYIFQPHGYSPTRLLKKEYIEVFTQNLRDSDHLIILPIYYAGGTASKDISSNDLAQEISAQGKSVEVVEKRADIFQRLNKYHAYIIFGARDETLADFARELAGKLSK
jgi:UDP-N-acetylmuramate--alanine ligase